MILVVMLQNQAHDEQNDAFRGRYLNMAIEGMEVLQGVLSEANVRISILEQVKEKPVEVDPPPWAKGVPRGTCADPKEQITIEPRFNMPEGGKLE